MLRFALFVALLLAVLPSSAKACVWLPLPEQSKKEQRHSSRQQTIDLQRIATQRLVLGGVDAAKELAEILVPNVRPIRLEYSSCGPEGEIDFAGSADAFNEGVSNDPRLKSLDLSNYRSVVRDFDGDTSLGPPCNAEFRDRFSALLRSNFNEDELRAAWLFLMPRTRQNGIYGSVYHRLISFDLSTRRPPIRWRGEDEWIRADIDRFKKKDLIGRRLDAEISVFWTQQRLVLDSDELVCPKAKAAWRNDQERLIETILRERDKRNVRRKPQQVQTTN